MTIKLIEVQKFDYNLVEKAKRDGVLMTLEGVFQRADTENANKRIYPSSLWQKILSDEEINERISNRTMLGELDHPTSGATSLTRASHVVTGHKLLPNGEVRGVLEILDTPAGKIAETMIRAGVWLGVSSRGDGSVEKKGESSEVQDDFRLETYDLVLKPSTPGAYPQLIESVEESEKNILLIADAVEELVKSTDELDVLLECHKIISVLEGCESRRNAILSVLKDKLSSLKESKEVTNQNNITEETLDMDKNTDLKSLNVSPELAVFLREQVERGIGEAVKEKDQKISGLNEMVVSLTTIKEDLTKRFDAACKIIEEYQRVEKTLRESNSTDAELKARYGAAVKLLDESVKRLKEFGGTKRRLEAAKSLLSVSIDRHKTEAVNQSINKLLRNVSESVSKKLRPILKECSSPSEVATRFKELSSLVETVTKVKTKEPLPSPRRKLSESKNHSVAANHPNPIVSRLLARMAGNVR